GHRVAGVADGGEPDQAQVGRRLRQRATGHRSLGREAHRCAWYTSRARTNLARRSARWARDRHSDGACGSRPISSFDAKVLCRNDFLRERAPGTLRAKRPRKCRKRQSSQHARGAEHEMSPSHYRGNYREAGAHTLAVVMAGGSGTRLGELTRWHSKPALPFGGQYRNIDFPLSNCVNSGLRQIAVLTQYKAHSLIQHLTQGWSFLRPELNEYIELWPAQQRKGQRWYDGTADAVYQ